MPTESMAAVCHAAIFLLIPLYLNAQPRGSVSGQVRDVDTKLPLSGATVYIETIQRGTATDQNGRFSIMGLGVDSYSLRFSYVGYRSVTETDVIIRPDRITFVDVELQPAIFGSDEAVVTAETFRTSNEFGIIVGRDAEEIRRAPGAAGDVSRALAGLPSVGKLNDLRNGLVVRGGSPIENAFFVDGIQIQNLNHFPTQGASGGAIGIINPDLIHDVQFQSGGFGSSYGNRLSSVTNLQLREGNRKETEFQLDLNLGGFGFIGEGPIDSSGSSWIVSARRSYLDFLVNELMGDEVDAVPTYGDVQGKAVINLSQRSRLVVVGLLAIDLSGIDRSSAEDEDENTYGDADYNLGAVGVSWRYLLGKQGFMTSTISLGSNRTSIDSYETLSGTSSYRNESREYVLRMRNVTSLVGGKRAIELGMDAELEFGDYRLFYAPQTDPFGRPQAGLGVGDALRVAAVGLFGTYSWRPLPRVSISPGLRVDYSSTNQRLIVSPRIGTNLDLDQRTHIGLSAGKYSQRLPAVLLAQSFSGLEAPSMHASDLVANFSRLLNRNTRLTIEGFLKKYDNFPMDPSQGTLFVVDELFYKNESIGDFGGHEVLLAKGHARSMGIELMVQKKLAEHVYGLISTSFSRSRYEDLTGIWRPRVTDNRFMATIEGGYKPNERWEFSLRWLYAGGPAYTPFDAAASATANTGIYDADRINGDRLPDYHSLSVRVDRRYHFRSSSLIAYISIWNAYGHRNIAGYYWNEVDARVQAIEQFGTLPILGLEFEF